MEPEIKKCEHCEEEGAQKRNDLMGSPVLCWECYTAYDNKTGHCSLACCISGECDESC